MLGLESLRSDGLLDGIRIVINSPDILISEEALRRGESSERLSRKSRGV